MYKMNSKTVAKKLQKWFDSSEDNGFLELMLLASESPSESLQALGYEKLPLLTLSAGGETQKAEAQKTAVKPDEGIRVYLRAMGKVPLLTKEKEVSIAKEIEEAEKELVRVLLSAPYTVHEFYLIASRIRSGRLDPARVIEVSDDDKAKIEKLKKQLLISADQLIFYRQQITALEKKLEKLQKKLKKTKRVENAINELQNKINELRKKQYEILSNFPL